MFEAFDRSWALTKISFGVIRQDKEMLLFPVLGSFFSLLYSALLLWPTLLTHVMQGNEVVTGTFETIVLFVTYLGLAFIGTFFNVCTVYTAKERFAGGDATFMDSINFALSRIHLIFMWSLVAATVGLILRALDQAADRVGGIGGTIMGGIVSLIGMAWSVVTIFVVPVMVYEELGPFEAISRSTQTIKETWGESLIANVGMGIIQFFAVLPGVALLVLGIVTAAWPLAIFGGIWLVGVALTFTVATTVFHTALYEYANTGLTPGAFDEGTLHHAFGPKGR